MPLPIQRFVVLVKIVGVLLVSALMARPFVAWLAFACPLFLLGPIYGLNAELFRICLGCWAVCLLIGVPIWMHHLLADQPEEMSVGSRIMALQQLPGLQAVVATEAKQLSRLAPEIVVMTAGPLHDQQDVWTVARDTSELRRSIEIPIGPFALWSVLDLRCHVAHALLRPKPPRLVARLLLAQLQDYAAMLSVRQALGEAAPIAKLWLALGNSLYQLAHRWNLVADIETDRKVAKLYGQDAVTSWMQRWWVGENALLWIWESMVVESALRGFVPPFLRDLRLLEANRDDDTEQVASSANTGPNGPGNPDPHAEDPVVVNLRVRMQVLAIDRDMPSAMDPRHAIDLLEDIAKWERRVSVWALERRATASASGTSDEALQSISWTEYPECVILPCVTEDVHRNAALFANKTLVDLPSIAQNAGASIPLLVVGDQLLDDEGKALHFSRCLESFLITELIRRGWRADFVFNERFLLRRAEDRLEVFPGKLVESLVKQQMDESDFARAVGLPGGSC